MSETALKKNCTEYQNIAAAFASDAEHFMMIMPADEAEGFTSARCSALEAQYCAAEYAEAARNRLLHLLGVET